MTLRQVQLWLQGASRRDAYEIARITRAVWVGTHFSGKDVDRFIADILDVDQSLPEGQVIFAMQAATEGLPKINWHNRKVAA